MAIAFASFVLLYSIAKWFLLGAILPQEICMNVQSAENQKEWPPVKIALNKVMCLTPK